MFDSNKDGLLTQEEWLSTWGETPTTYESFFELYTSNAAAICEDPKRIPGFYPQADHPVWGPLSDMYFGVDRDYSGSMSLDEWYNFWFGIVDSNQSGEMSSEEF